MAPPKGSKKPPGSGKKKGSKNKATLEKERLAELAIEERLRKENQELADKIAAEGVKTLDDARALAAAKGPMLMKDIGFQFTRVFAGMAALHQPAPPGHPPNPNADPKLFREYAALALQGAKDFAQYESPKLSAVMVGGEMVTEIAITGGPSDDEDGGFQPAEAMEMTIDQSGESVEPAPDIKKAVNE
jgi:hypothetical protein